MGTTTLISLEEYLNTSYNPDMDYVDGVLVRRNVGVQRHGRLQTILAVYFAQFQQSHRMRVFTETRLLVDPATGRHRIPDVMAIRTPLQKGKVVVDVPALVVEIKSPDDSFDDILDRSFDYEKLKTPNIIIMDPDNKRAWTFDAGSLRLLTDLSIEIYLPDSAPLPFPWLGLFAKLDEE